MALVRISWAAPLVGDFLAEISPQELASEAQAFGAVDERGIVPLLGADGKNVGWGFLTSDFVPTAGYSGKPIHIAVGLSPEGYITGAKLLKHSEPIVLVGIPESEIRTVIDHYKNFDLHKIDARDSQDLEIIAGATVTIMVIDDSILRAGVRVAQILGLSGFEVAEAGAAREIDTSIDRVSDWETLTGDGSIRSLLVDVAQINQDFTSLGDPRAEKDKETGDATDPFIHVFAALVSQPSIGRSLLGEAEYTALAKQLEPGQSAILLMGNGSWSFKGSGYVRGGIFDRFQIVQGSISHRFRDRMHQRMVRVAAAGAEKFSEVDLFIFPKDVGFDPTAPFEIQFLVSRAVGPIEKLFLTYDLSYVLGDAYIKEPPAPTPAVAFDLEKNTQSLDTQNALWKRVWEKKKLEIIILGVALFFLTIIFFFQNLFTRNAKVFERIRTAYLIFTLVFVGWIANAQLSVVNVFAFADAIFGTFNWTTFLMDPLIFILWFSVAAALLFWGRGAYCGWLCPFGAFQELLSKIARKLSLPQIEIPWSVHERLWALKYIIFLVLFATSLYSFEIAERLAEIEPFKTAIILKFARPLPFVLIAVAFLVPGLFVERFYCRYICPLGAGLAIPARLHMFRWLRRYPECGSPCQLCAINCPVDAIHKMGEINPNECISCLNCQILYQDKEKCPVVIKRDKRLKRDLIAAEELERHQ